MKLIHLVKPIHIVFALLLVIAGITLFVLTSDAPSGASGVAHPTLAGLSMGGDGAAKLSTIGKAPYYFQIMVILLAGTLLYMGIPVHRRDRLLRLCFGVGIAFALFVWVMLYSGYEAYLATGQTRVVFGFPVPTNWMFWGVWGSFAAFDVFYMVAFRRYFLHPDDEAAFNELVKEVEAENQTETPSREAN